MDRSGRRARRLRHNRRATAATEFAILSIPFMVLTLGTMEVGYDFFVQAALDQAVQTAARSVQVGSISKSGSQTIAQFVQASVCPALGSLLNCGQLYVSVSTIPSGTGQNFYTYLTANPITLASITSNNNVVCTGTAGQMMVVRAFYLSPSFLGLLIPSFSTPSPINAAQRVHATFATAGFVNEQFNGGQSGC